MNKKTKKKNQASSLYMYSTLNINVPDYTDASLQSNSWIFFLIRAYIKTLRTQN